MNMIESVGRTLCHVVLEVPGVFHHADEILVVVDGGADTAVVVDEFLFRYLHRRSQT